MGLNPTGRFSIRAADYARYRPGYLREIIPLLERECGLSADSTVADVGSGTGLLARLFLEYGCTVLGIEPNAEMRGAGEIFLAEFERFRSIDARAEQTALPGSSVDLITAGQAFHWFEPEATRAEFHRVLRPDGQVVLIWNERIVCEGFLAGYEEMLDRWAPEYKAADHRRVDSTRIAEFFGHHDWTLATFDNQQEFDLDGVIGRLASSSYAPLPGAEGYQPMLAELARLFARYEEGGRIRFLYQTNVYHGRL